MSVAEAQAAGVGVCFPNLRPDLAEYLGGAGYLYDSLAEVAQVVAKSPPVGLEAQVPPHRNMVWLEDLAWQSSGPVFASTRCRRDPRVVKEGQRVWTRLESWGCAGRHRI